MDVYVNSADRSEGATSFASRNTTSRVEVLVQLLGEYGNVAGVVCSLQPTAEEVEERSHNAEPLLFSDL
jgi:hypothetical protein